MHGSRTFFILKRYHNYRDVGEPATNNTRTRFLYIMKVVCVYVSLSLYVCMCADLSSSSLNVRHYLCMCWVFGVTGPTRTQ